MFGEGDYATSLQHQARSLGSRSRSTSGGFREDVRAELRELDVLVHCSVRPEPFGQVVLEGLAAGVPVVATAAGGPAELITHDVHGILTEPGDRSELATALLQLVADPQLRTRLAGSGARA